MSLLDTFIEFEDKNQLFDRHIDDFYYWHYIRYDIYKQVFWREALPSQKAAGPKLKDMMKTLYCAAFRNTWFVHKHIDILALGYLRKIKNDDGAREDPYIEPIIRNTTHTSLTLEAYSRWSDNMDSDPKYVKFIDDMGLYSRIVKKCLSSKEKELLHNEAEYIYKLFSKFESPLTETIIYQRLKAAYGGRKALMRKMGRLLDRITPYCVIAAPGYTDPALILNELALKRGIPTIEIEHGFFTEEHAPQNFYRKQLIRSYPQYYFANSQYKVDNVRFPIAEGHIKVVGSPYLEKRVKNRKSQMVKGEIVLLDDNKYSDILLDFADKLLKHLSDNALSDYHVTLKSHPANPCDSPAWEKLKARQDITCIVGIKGKNVYDCLEQAEIVVGVSSSTLFEAQAYGCKVCAIQCDGSKMMQRFVEQGYGIYVSEPKGIFEAESAGETKELWHPEALKSTLAAIDELIEISKKRKGTR